MTTLRGSPTGWMKKKVMTLANGEEADMLTFVLGIREIGTLTAPLAEVGTGESK